MKISGRVVSKRPISLSRAAKLISRFAAVENGSSPAVSVYLQRAADAFNHLVQSHDKRYKLKNLNNFDSKNIQTYSENVVRESEKQIVNDGGAAEAPANKKKKKKKKKGKSGEASLDSENIQTEKDSENVVRESVKESINAAEAPVKKKKRKRGDASLDSKNDSENVERESVKEIGDSAAKKKKRKKRKTGEADKS